MCVLREFSAMLEDLQNRQLLSVNIYILQSSLVSRFESLWLLTKIIISLYHIIYSLIYNQVMLAYLRLV